MFILCSKSDNSLKKSKMFQMDKNFQIVFVEDIIKNFKKISIKSDDVFYFLCTSKINKKVLNLLEQKNCKVLNKTAIQKNLNKYDIQQKLFCAEIPVPEIIEQSSITKNDFPCFCKSKNHGEFIAEFYTPKTLEIFAKKFNINDYYFEKPVKYDYIEKLYYVCGEVCFDDNSKLKQNEKNCKKLQNILKNIAKTLQFDIFSAEFFVTKNNIVLFDVNPNTGLFGSSHARKQLLRTN